MNYQEPQERELAFNDQLRYKSRPDNKLSKTPFSKAIKSNTFSIRDFVQPAVRNFNSAWQTYHAGNTFPVEQFPFVIVGRDF